MSYVNKLEKYIQPPKWLKDNLIFEGLTGSQAYGITGSSSDWDINGICIPPKGIIFPHTQGYIPGFGTSPPSFDVFQQHHIKHNTREYDLTIYSIVKFFQLAMENNPNIIELLFLPRSCVLFSTPLYEHIREHRHMFLHKGAYHKLRGYSYSQMSKIRNKTNSSNPKRQQLIQDHGYDTKFAAHCVRLMLQCEQILTQGTLDLQRNSEHLKAIRRGEFTLDHIVEWFNSKELELEKIYNSSQILPYSPRENEIKNLLLECLEMHYQDLSDAITITTTAEQILTDLKNLMVKYQ